MTIVKGQKSTLGNRIIFGMKRPKDLRKKSEKPMTQEQVEQEVMDQMSGSPTGVGPEDSKNK